MALINSSGKKGVFFTFVALTFLTLLIVSASVLNTSKMREKSLVIETKVDTLNKFVADVEDDLGRAAYISGFRSLVSMYEYVLLNGEFIADVDSAFDELFLDGTIGGSNASLLVNNTFTDWAGQIQSRAAEIGINITIIINSITLSHDHPWTIRIDLNTTFHVQDTQGVASWNKQKQVAAYVEIEGFGDPVYIVKTNGLVERKVRQTPFITFVSGTDVTNLLNHTYEGYYINHDDAPNYLQRLSGSIDSTSLYGIESLVDIAELASKGVSVKDKTIVDHKYFIGARPADDHVLGTPSWFKIDRSGSHQQLYQVEDILG